MTEAHAVTLITTVFVAVEARRQHQGLSEGEQFIKLWQIHTEEHYATE